MKDVADFSWSSAKSAHTTMLFRWNVGPLSGLGQMGLTGSNRYLLHDQFTHSQFVHGFVKALLMKNRDCKDRRLSYFSGFDKGCDISAGLVKNLHICFYCFRWIVAPLSGLIQTGLSGSDFLMSSMTMIYLGKFG